jgi:thioredoxin-related protein
MQRLFRLTCPGIALLAMLFMVQGAQAAEPQYRDANAYFFDTTFGDFAEELENAKAEGKQAIMIMFEMDECPFCHRMRMTVLSRPDVQAYFKKHFMLFHVDVEGDIEMSDFQGNPTTMKAFAARHRVRATPVFQFFDLEGNPIRRGRYTGATRDYSEFILLGQYIAEGINEQQPFTRYKRSQKNNR